MINDLKSLIRQAKTDEQILRALSEISNRFRFLKVQRIHTELADGAQLAWSGIYGHWRFVIRYEDEVEDLFAQSPEIRVEAFVSGAMERLVVRALSGIKDANAEVTPPIAQAAKPRTRRLVRATR